MSALRIARPGLPVVLIDLGPSVGRKTMTRYGIRGGGTMVTGTYKPPLTPEQREADRARNRAYYAAHTEQFMERQRRYRGKAS